MHHHPSRAWTVASAAADLLASSPDATIGSIATRVGHGSAFALSTAFKSAHGVSPAAYRRSTHQAAQAG